jgi:hypothetical protein
MSYLINLCDVFIFTADSSLVADVELRVMQVLVSGSKGYSLRAIDFATLPEGALLLLRLGYRIAHLQ